MPAFRSEDEFKTVFEQIFQLMNAHPDVGRTLRGAHAPHRFEITDSNLEKSLATVIASLDRLPPTGRPAGTQEP